MGQVITCDDDNPCTTDACEPGAGACVNAAIEGCCQDPGDCGLGAVCIDQMCNLVLCQACTDDSECGHEGSCVTLPSGGRCLALCDEEVAACPPGYQCGDVSGSADPVCVPEEGDCVCTKAASLVCQGAVIVAVDSCGAVEALEACLNGCVEGPTGARCCPDGTEPRDGDCGEDVVADEGADAGPEPVAEPVPEPAAEIPSAAETPAAADAESDAGASGDSEDDGARHQSGSRDEGCATGGMEPSAMLMTALLMMLLGRIRRERARACARRGVGDRGNCFDATGLPASRRASRSP